MFFDKTKKTGFFKQFIYIFNEHYVSVVSDKPEPTVFANKNKKPSDSRKIINKYKYIVVLARQSSVARSWLS